MNINLKNKTPKYYLNSIGEFIIENYNFSKPFANCFPGIAGKYGIPMWVFYVNRGQAIASFGTKDKDHAIVEFFPANRSWQLVSSQGFRTFIKVFKGNKIISYEPFQDGLINSGFKINNKISITSYDLKLEEKNLSLGLETAVEYFTIPQDYYAGLVRIVTLKNTTNSPQKLQLLDGLPQIVPYGEANLFLKKLSRTIEAWITVKNLERGVPFYKLDVDPTDRPEVTHIKEGNFYLGFHHEKETPKIITPIVDPQSIFGMNSDFSYPYNFFSAKYFRAPKNEIIKSKTPSAFLLLNLEIKPKQEKTFYSVIGYMRSQETLNNSIAKIISPGYITKKKEENRKIIEEIQSDINTISSSKELDLYSKQTYLDNVMRGGYPVLFKSNSDNLVFHLYSRKHGDLERDYNKFHIQASYFSQGNGNYRDMNQNRRSEVWFNPQIKEENLIYFLNLLQTDGYNPLVVKGESFILKDGIDLKVILKGVAQEKDILEIIAYINRPFTPGEVIIFIEEKQIHIKTSYDEFLDLLLSCCLKIQEAEHAEGFWTDHWTYNLDLLESYLGIYPENLKKIILEKKIFTFFDNTEIVKPRQEKYILKDGLIRQLHSVHPDNAKREMIKRRTAQPHCVRTKYGNGIIYQTTLINKLLCILVNKLATLDPFGCGIEMEANKPNWFDALNGLPALFGSSLCETLELKRLIIFVKEVLEKGFAENIFITEEVYSFLIGIDSLIKETLNSNSSDRDYLYWDKSASLKEDYRTNTKFGFSGREIEMATSELILFLNSALEKVELGINKAKDKKRFVYSSYFINEVTEYVLLKPPFVKPTRFKQIKLPLFLEGQMHALRSAVNIDEAKTLYRATKNSQLYDKKLKMYKVTASLADMPEEIGRCRAFPPGWLESESIWLHMEYKYLLEILKKGLYSEFYLEFKNLLIPFQKAKNYGRSILENSSFIVSSAFSDKSLHGNGFVARLSGSTAEFLQIWLIMNLGPKPFFLNNKNELNLSFQPKLAGWLFDKKGKYSFNFLSKICVSYYNPQKKDTFGKNPVRPKKIIFDDKDGKQVEISSDIIPHPYALQIRKLQIKRIDVYF